MSSMPASAELHQASASSGRNATSLVAQFDIYLRIVEHAYLGFFRERNKIEEVYIDSLRKLHRKSKAIDPFLDSSVSSCTMRAAWDEVRDSLGRETQVRQEFSNTLANEIIRPLVALKGIQALTRECIKNDLKESAAVHADLAKRIPRVRDGYLRKCQELKDLDPSSINPLNGAMPHSLLGSGLSSTSDIVSPLSTRLHHRNRSSVLGAPLGDMPSTTSSLTEFTRHRFNQFIGEIKGTSRGADIATRSVHAKEAVDQADKEYRWAIHQLETLRLKRMTTLEYAYQNLGNFVSESTETAKGLLLRYFSAIVKACSAHSKLAMDAQPVVEKVSPENDSSVFTASLHRSPALSIPRPIFYYNYHVGECPDLVFGCKLVDYATARGSENDVPKVIRTCIEEVNRRGLDADGIYMVTGRRTKVKELQSRFERSDSERTVSFDPQRDDIYSIASLLKLYLQELPEPLFTYPLHHRIRDSEILADDIANLSPLRSKIQRLPTIHKVSLRALVRHLSQVASHARRNKMDSKNLAAVFGLLVFGKDETPEGVPLKLSSKDLVMEILITNADSLFEESLPIRSAEPAPLPINTHGLTGSRTSVAFPPFEETQVAKITPQSPRSTTTSMSSSSPTCSPITPSYSSADSSGSHMSMQVPGLSELINFSALRLHTEQSELQQVRVPVAVERDSVVLHERGLNGSQVFLPSQLPEQQERKRHLEESLAYLSP